MPRSIHLSYSPWEIDYYTVYCRAVGQKKNLAQNSPGIRFADARIEIGSLPLHIWQSMEMNGLVTRAALQLPEEEQQN